MKVAKWKVLGLAGALALGYAVSSEAAQIKVDDKTWANFGLNMKIMYTNQGKRFDGDWSKNVFDVTNTKIYFVGQVTPIFQFYSELDTDKVSSVGYAKLSEAGINLALAKEFQVLAGHIRKTFTRADISGGYDLLIPTGYFFNPQSTTGRVSNIFTYDGNSDSGLMVHGDLAGGMFTYRVGVFNNEDRDKPYKGFEWNARVEFQPLMLGFKPESAATVSTKIADTYLGSKDIFTIGLGYMSAKRGTETVDGWTADVTFEKKFGNLVPNLQIGYVDLSDTHDSRGKSRDSEAWYIQGQLLYDQVVVLGKPALAIRFDTTENDKKLTVGSTLKDAKLDRWGVAFNYYIKGQAARISLGFDTAKYKDGSKDVLKAGNYKTSVTDWYLYLQSRF